jgi:hypothetical protein
MMISLELQSIVLDYALPAIVVIGTGLLSYVLTGGIDEYPVSNNSTTVGIEALHGGDGGMQEHSRYNGSYGSNDRTNNVRPCYMNDEEECDMIKL